MIGCSRTIWQVPGPLWTASPRSPCWQRGRRCTLGAAPNAGRADCGRATPTPRSRTAPRHCTSSTTWWTRTCAARMRFALSVATRSAEAFEGHHRRELGRVGRPREACLRAGRLRPAADEAPRLLRVAELPAYHVSSEREIKGRFYHAHVVTTPPRPPRDIPTQNQKSRKPRPRSSSGLAIGTATSQRPAEAKPGISIKRDLFWRAATPQKPRTLSSRGCGRGGAPRKTRQLLHFAMRQNRKEAITRQVGSCQTREKQIIGAAGRE